MSKFIGEFVREIDNKKTSFQQLFGLDDKTNMIESILKEELNKHWHNLPVSVNFFKNEFTVDSSSASRTLINGVDFFLIRALMLGTGNYTKPKLRFEMVKGIRDYNVTSSFERILRDIIEIDIILENLEDIPKESIVLIDGNLYGRFTHLMKELHLKEWYHLPLELLDAMQQLLAKCDERKIMLVGVSKFSKTRVFTTALLNRSHPIITEPDHLDVELLYKWKHGQTGYTSPLMLGDYAIAKEIKALQIEPEKYIQQYFHHISPNRQEWATRVIAKIPTSPAIIMFHIIPRKGAQPLRIDIPAYNLGIKKKIMNVQPFEFIQPEKVNEIVQQIIADFGGRDVYNALLYIVDREVRLGVKTVDSVYKSVLSKELGLPIEYDRSTRRFI
jgi:hypothetical protein